MSILEKSIEEFEEIDFSLILKNSFHATLDQNNRILFNQSENYFNDLCAPHMADVSMNTENSEDLSLLAGNIATNALHIPRSLFCPFCADEYMFEFTLKDHLKRKHAKELIQKKQEYNLLPDHHETDHSCPYCGAVFYWVSLLPKHILNFHGRNVLQHWRNLNNNDGLCYQNKENEPSIMYAACSPGLSDIFERLDTKDSNESPNIKSILKKTPQKSNKIIHSPSGASIRRSKSDLIKRSLSARRELRFDLPPISNSPEKSSIRKYRKYFNMKKLFTRKFFIKSNQRKCVEMELPPNIVTSTPINFLDDEKILRKKHYKNDGKVSSKPLLFNSERFQCAHCKLKFYSNAELVIHFKQTHKGVRNFLKPHYQCGQCGIKFFRNRFLIRHCYQQHTSQQFQG